MLQKLPLYLLIAFFALPAVADAQLDLLYSRISNSSVQDESRVCLNDGDETFDCQNIGDDRQGAQFFVTSDFDNDGDVDAIKVVSSNTVPNELCLNNGDNTFSCESTGTPSLSQEAVAVDVNSDGNVDVVYAHSTQVHEVCINDGSAAFSCSSVGEAPYSSVSVSTGDFNGDGFADLVFPRQAPQEETNTNNEVCLGLAGGGFNCFDLTSNQNLQRSFTDYSAVADFNNDGDQDIFFANLFGTGSPAPHELCLGDGAGGFQCAYLNSLLSSSFQFESGVTAADFDLDGNQDVAFSNQNRTSGQRICFGDGNGDFSCSVTLPVGLSNSIASGDIDGNGLVDLAYSNPLRDSQNEVCLNQSGGFNCTVIDSELGRTNGVSLAAFSPPLLSNNPPELSLIGDKVVNEGELLEFQISAQDIDGDVLTYSASNLPVGSTFNPSTQTFSWQTDFSDSGNYPEVEFVVTDDGTPMELDVELITITVGDVNRHPLLSGPGPQEILEEESLSFGVQAADPDGDSVVLSAQNVPSGAVFVASSGVFSWTPSLTQSGVYTVTFVATDNGVPTESGVLDVVITVGDNPTPVEQIEDLIEDIVDLDLPNNVENSYLANLQKVEQFILTGKITPAINQLNAFINKINQDLNQGLLSQSEYDSLLLAANQLIQDIQQ